MNAPEKKSIEAILARWPFFRLTIAVKMLIGYLGLSVVVVLDRRPDPFKPQENE